jgi:chromosome segregation ATPase
MPEIATVERVRDKLREFDERVDGAIAAAKTLARVKTDAEKLLTEIQNVSNKGEQSLQKAEAVRLQFQQLQSDWATLKQQVDNAQAESKETRELLLSEFDAAIQSLGSKVSEAEERLKATNRASLAEQAELLKRLDASTKANADVAAKAQSAVTETASRLDGLLATIREELQSEVRTKLTSAGELLESELQRVQKYLEKEQTTLRQTVEQQATDHQRTVHEGMAAFQSEMKRSLTEHQQGVDGQLTDFLNKQNALVQNLSQQIDSFNRVCHTQSEDLAATNRKLNELGSAFQAHKASAETGLAGLASGIADLKSLLAGFQEASRFQGETIAAVDSSLQETTARFDQTLEKLKQLPLVGGKFK